MRRVTFRRSPEGERGDSLIELMVVMIIFTIILGIITTAIVTMMQQVDKQSGLADNLGNARKAIETLDGQVRFANAITTPGTGTSGDTYVEFQSLETNVPTQPEVCNQWRYDIASQTLQYRSWDVPTSTPATVTPSAWITTALKSSPVSGTSIFSLTPPAGIAAQNAGNTDHQVLYMDFITTDGSPPQTTTSEVGVTAINSKDNNATNSSVCQEVGRP